MSVTELAQELRSMLYKYFPHQQEIDLSVEDAFLVLRFIGISLSIEKNTPLALEILLGKAITILEETNTRIKNEVQNEKDKKIQDFRNNCIRQQSNSEMAASVASKVEFFDQTMRKTVTKPSINIKIPSKQQTDEITELLDVLNDEIGPIDKTRTQLPETESYSFDKTDNHSFNRDNSILQSTVTEDSSFNRSIITNSITTNEDSSLCKAITENGLSSPSRKSQQLDKNAFLCHKSKFHQFKETAFNMMFTGLIGIRSVDRVIKKAKSRGLFKKSGIVFDDIEALNSIKSEKVGFDLFDSSMLNTSQADSIIKSGIIGSSFNSSFELVQKNVEFGSINKLQIEDKIQPSKIRKNNDSQPKSIEDILEGRKYGNIEFSRLFTEKNSVTQKKDSVGSDDVNPLRKMLQDTNPHPNKIPERQVEYNASLDTSLILDENKEAKSANPSPTNNDRNTIETRLPDSSMFKKIIIECKDVQYKSIEIIRRFCLHYNLYFPEFEIVRENDVFRCTATFLDINFVSSYEYDKMDAKNGACKKVLEYISRNWEKIFKK